MKEILTIAIPTYNRAEMLNENLNRIFKCNSDKFCVLVSDNCSNDDTEKVCKSFLNRKQGMSYYKHESNVGYDRNVLKCLESSNTPYVWFLSDDDFLDADSLEVVINFLSMHKPSGLLVNAKVMRGSDCIIKNMGKEDNNLIVDCNSNAFLKYLKWSTLLSSIVVRGDLVNKNNLAKFVGTCFIQIPLFWDSVYSKKIAIMGGIKLLKNDGLTHDFCISDSDIWVKNWVHTILELDSSHFNYDLKREALTTLYGRGILNLSGIVSIAYISRCEHRFNIEDYFSSFRHINLTKLERILVLILLLIPPSLLGKVYISIKKFRHKKNT